MTDLEADLMLAQAEIAKLKAENARLREIIEYQARKIRNKEGGTDGRCEVDKDYHGHL